MAQAGEGGEGAVVELRARYLPLSLRGAGVEAVEHVEADQMTGARVPCAGRALDLDAKTSPDG